MSSEQLAVSFQLRAITIREGITYDMESRGVVERQIVGSEGPLERRYSNLNDGQSDHHVHHHLVHEHVRLERTSRSIKHV